MKKIMACFLAAVMLLSITGCQQGDSGASAPDLLEPVGIKKDQDVYKVERGEIVQMKLSGGEVVPYVERLSFGIDGKLATMNVVLGDKVQKGDLLASLTQSTDKEKAAQLEAEIAHIKKLADFEDQQTQIEIDIKKAELAMMQANGETAEACAVKQVEIEIAEAALRQSQELRALSIRSQEAELAKLQTNVQAIEIVAPCDGRIVDVANIKLGGAVEAGETVLCIADESQVFVTIPDTNYTVSYWESLEKITGQIIRKEYEMTFDTSVQYELPSEENQDPKLTNPLLKVNAETSSLVIGDYVAVRLIEQVRSDVLKIPLDALYSDGISYFVYKVENGKRVVCNVQTGIRTDSYVEIIAGLKEGDEVSVKN